MKVFSSICNISLKKEFLIILLERYYFYSLCCYSIVPLHYVPLFTFFTCAGVYVGATAWTMTIRGGKYGISWKKYTARKLPKLVAGGSVLFSQDVVAGEWETVKWVPVTHWFLGGGYMDVPVRTGSLKIKMTFQAGLRFISGAIQLYTLRYMQKN